MTASIESTSHVSTLPARPGTPLRVVVVGGGLAGMASAVALESADATVTLVEARKSLGGRAGSFEDPQTGERLDNCQHVLLGCCTNLLDFYARTGATDQVKYERAIYFRTPAGKRYSLFGIRPLPAPLHLGFAGAAFGILTIRERLAFARGMIAMLRLGRAGRLKLVDVPFGDWLKQHGQTDGLIQKIYDPVVVSGLNEETRASSAAYAIQIFQDAMLANSSGYVVGMPRTTLGALYDNLPCRDVRLGTRVASLRFDATGATGVELTNGDVLDADAVVVATNHHAMRKWIPEEWQSRDSRFARLDEIDSVPILGVHLWFDRAVLAESHCAFIEGPLQWVFRKDESGTSVHGVISAARAFVDRSKDEILKEFEQQVRKSLPLARDATLKRGVIVIEKRATFSPVPGIDAIRPFQAPPAGGIERLFLAGDYTQTGWPATMEGAVRSGYLAADAVLAHATRFVANAGTPSSAGSVNHAGSADRVAKKIPSFLVPDLPVEWSARLLGL